MNADQDLRSTPSPAEQASRGASVALALTLMLLTLTWELVLHASWFWALKALPLVPALIGLWRYRLYTYRWVSLLVWLYATEGLVHVGSSQGLPWMLGLLESLLAVGLFAAVTVHIRQRLAAARAGAVGAP
jgi:uncharacterized membrane protein